MIDPELYPRNSIQAEWGVFVLGAGVLTGLIFFGAVAVFVKMSDAIRKACKQ